jgi:hypothetical protein
MHRQFETLLDVECRTAFRETWQRLCPELKPMLQEFKEALREWKNESLFYFYVQKLNDDDRYGYKTDEPNRTTRRVPIDSDPQSPGPDTSISTLTIKILMHLEFRASVQELLEKEGMYAMTEEQIRYLEKLFQGWLDKMDPKKNGEGRWRLQNLVHWTQILEHINEKRSAESSSVNQDNVDDGHRVEVDLRYSEAMLDLFSSVKDEYFKVDTMNNKENYEAASRVPKSLVLKVVHQRRNFVTEKGEDLWPEFCAQLQDQMDFQNVPNRERFYWRIFDPDRDATGHVVDPFDAETVGPKYEDFIKSQAALDAAKPTAAMTVKPGGSWWSTWLPGGKEELVPDPVPAAGYDDNVHQRVVDDIGNHQLLIRANDAPEGEIQPSASALNPAQLALVAETSSCPPPLRGCVSCL